MKTAKMLLFAGCMVVLTWALPAAAQDADPPGRVARLSYTSGAVSFQPGGEGDWLQAVWNRPLTTGDNLWTDKDSRAELHTGSTAIRMAPETSLTLLQLDDSTTQLRLSTGSVLLRVKHLDNDDFYELDTPNLAFVLRHTGEYRIDVDPDGDYTVITAWKGRGEVTGGGATYTVVAGQRATFSGTDGLDHQIDQVPGPDAFDDWAFSRDQREDRAESANYISPEVTGYEDLDDYGRWHYAAGYGPVWTPVAVPGGWAPYRYGHWVWVQPWGWTWIEDEPWGFAPFHYGRWVELDGTWSWVPGPVMVRPVYAPALVAFVGGGGFRLAASLGGAPGVAWFPLGPGEVYVPGYRVSPAYVKNVNITNTRVTVTQVTNVYNTYHATNVTRITYVNRTAVTAVTRDTFVNARPVSKNLARVDVREMAQAPVGALADVQPVKTSVLGAGARSQAAPPARILDRRVVAVRNPVPPPAPLAERQGAARPGTMPAIERGTYQPEPAAARAPDHTYPAPHPAEIARPVIDQPANRAETVRPQQPNVPRPRQTVQEQHPLVKPAPPVQERPQHEQNEAAKFHAWQQQRQQTQSAPPPPKRERPRNQPPQEDKKPSNQSH